MKRARRTKAKPGSQVFVRACRIKNYPTKADAIAHTKAQAEAAGVEVLTPKVTRKTMVGGDEAWVVEFSRPAPKRKSKPVEQDDDDAFGAEQLADAIVEAKPSKRKAKATGIIKHETGRYRYEVNGVRYRTKKEAEEASK